MKPFTLSHSSYGRFVTCPKSFQLHYIDKLRPTTTPSHLIFGGAIDKGLNALIDQSQDPQDVCTAELNRLVVEDVEFFRADYDGELIDEETKAQLNDACTKIAGVPIDADHIAPTLLNRPVATLSDKQRTVLALCCATSLQVKAKLMIEAYKREVMPKLRRVASSQESVRWTDENGNDFVGVLDLKGDVGFGEMPIDNKTSSRPYAQDAVEKSTQLAIYSKVTGHSKAAFIVMDKTIRKNRIKICEECGHDGTGGRHKTCDNVWDTNGRCGGAWTETIRPEASIQIIVGDVSPRLQEIVMEALSDTAQAIKAGHFPRNLNACDNQYGRPCPYREYCWRGDSTGLRVEKK
jgi:hypothetical protein